MSSGGFSSLSDTDSIKGAGKATTMPSRSWSWSWPSCLARFRPKHSRTSVVPSDSKTLHALFLEREAEGSPPLESMASKVSTISKKAKQPTLSSGKVLHFLNSIFCSAADVTTPKRTKKSSACSVSADHEDSLFESNQPVHAAATSSSTTCSSAAPLPRSCLSKHSSAARGRTGNVIKSRVRFYPLIVVVDEDGRIYERKPLRQQDKEREEINSIISLPVPTDWRIRGLQSKKMEQDPNLSDQKIEKTVTLRKNQSFSPILLDNTGDEGEGKHKAIFGKEKEIEEQDHNLRDLLMEKARRFEREESGENQKGDIEDDGEADGAESCSSSHLFELDHLTMFETPGKNETGDPEEDDEDDETESCSSSQLFELDHLALIGADINCDSRNGAEPAEYASTAPPTWS